MNRPRKKGSKHLPPNLYFDIHHKLYKYVHPQNKKSTYIGKDETEAIKAAKQLNSILVGDNDLVSKVIGSGRTLKQFIDERFIPYLLPERKRSMVTIKTYTQQLNKIKSGIGELEIDSITVKHIADYLNKFKPIYANRLRSLLMIVFKYAISEGLIDNNPAEITFKRQEEKRRRRLSKEGFDAIYAVAPKFLQNAMDLALITLQRREDICRMKFSDIKDEYLYVIQKKTQKHGDAAYIKIAIGKHLKEIISRCRDSILSPYLIHRVPLRDVGGVQKDHRTQITPGYLTNAFADARDKTGLYNDMDSEERPTFHEIRSLGVKLYEDEGVDSKNLAGHMTDAMQKHYKSGHGVEWTEAVSF